jgi:accessory gene regulator B
MFLMERLANDIASKIASELMLDKDKKEVIQYGTFNLIQMFFSITLVVFVGWLFHVTIEALIISFTTAILRKYSGGIHASSPGICNFIGIITCVLPGVLLRFFIGSSGTLNLVIISGVIAFVWSYYKLYKLAPVDNAKKPIKRAEKKKRMKKGSIAVLSVYLIIVILCIILYISIGDRKFLVYSTCIYLGALWQTFTLTNLGYLVLDKVDNFLSEILGMIRR